MKTALMILGIVILVGAIVYVVCAFIIVKISCRPPKRTDEQLYYEEISIKEVPRELYDIEYEELWQKSDYGYELFARGYIGKPTHKYIVLVHGHNAASSGMVRFMQLFYERGYNCVLPDNRYSARSGGDCISFGYYEQYDIIKWIDYIYSVDSEAQIGIMGESMGGAIAIMVAGIRKDLKFCIDYCGYADMQLEIKDTARSYVPLAFFSMPLARVLVKHYFDFDMRDVSPMESAKTIECPTLIMHSRGDKLVRYYHHELIQKNVRDVRHVAFPDAPHGQSLTRYPVLFNKSIIDFLDEIKF